MTLQEGDPPKDILRKVGVFKRWFYQIFQKADYFQAISSFLYDWAMKMGAKSGEIVPNGVDLTKFSIFNSQFSNKKDEKIIITVSRLVKKNGVDDLIKAIAQLDVKLLILGKGPDESKLRKLAKDSKIEDKVIFLGHIEYNNLPKYYSMADIFVRPSLSEGLGNVFLEAMACGVPIIGTPVGGILDFLEDRKTGLFCQINNPQDIAKKIKEILENNELRKSMVNNGLNLVKNEYSWDKISLKMEKIFKKL